jgi:simple sugar transport system ATP-binding protein
MLLRLEGIIKSFGAVRALRGVDMELDGGEVLGLAGDNGAGKSTLMKVLSGAEIPDDGCIYFEGKQVRFNSPGEARELGIEMVYQDLSICDTINVAKNLFIGREPVKKFLGLRFLNETVIHKKAKQILDNLGIHVPSTYSLVKTLSGGQRQAVAIGRTVLFNPKILILDEPTASLAVREVGKVLELIQVLKDRGVAIILISHRLQDIMEVADRIMIMYEGVKVAERKVSDTSLEELIRLIVREPSDVEGGIHDSG